MKNQVNEAIANYIENCSQMEITTAACQCGAITMFGGCESISFLATNAPYIKPTFEGVNDNCNRCANGWAVDKLDHSSRIKELRDELDELDELFDLDQITVAESACISWLTQEIERLEMEEQES